MNNEDGSRDAPDSTWIETEVGAAWAHGNELAENLFRDIREWQDAHPVTMRGVVDRRGRSTTFVLNAFDEPQLRNWTLRIGDALHNWRRMLDSVAWDLSERYSETPLTGQQRRSIKFPLFQSEEQFEAACSSTKHWLSALDTTHRERLSATQPFVARNPKESILHWLQDLDNIRKHRGGFALRRVIDHDNGFLFMKLEDATGEDLGVSDSAIHRLSWGRTLVEGLPVLRVNARGIARAEATDPVPVTVRLRRDDDHESDMEDLVHALSSQLATTLAVIYTGAFPQPRREYFGAWGATSSPSRG